MRKVYLSTAALMVVATVTTMPAVAQTSADTTKDDVELADVVVTANKRSQTLLEIPGALDAISGDDLQDRGVAQTTDLQSIVPSMNIGQLRGDTQIAIRGVGLTVTGSAPGVAVHVDGVYQPRPSMGELTQIDLDRVEVLRGPQGTLYGRNSNGGVINFITKAPTTEFGGYALASYQSYDEYRLQAAINVPISDNVRFRVTGDRWKRSNSWIENVAPNGPELEVGHSWYVRGHLEADITPALKASIIATYAQRDGTFVYYTNIDQPIAQAVAQNPILSTATIPVVPMTVAINDPVGQQRRYTSVAGILDWDMGDVAIKSTTALQRFRDNFQADFDATQLSLAPSRTDQLSRTFTQELTVAINKGNVQAVLGGFYMHDNFEFFLDFVFPNGAWLVGSPIQAAAPSGTGLKQRAQPYISKSLALFGDVTLEVADNIRLIGGLRYSKDNQRITQDSYFMFPNFALAFFPVGTPTAPAPDGSARFIVTAGPGSAVFNRTSRMSFDSWTPRAGIQIDLSKKNTLYATFSKGFKVGGYNYRTGIGATYQPEELTAYEVGSKNVWMDGRFSLNASAFYYDYKNLQVEQLNGFNFILANAPKARIYGAEFETVIRPVDRLTINSSLTLSNARFTEFSNGDILDGLGGVSQNLAGKPLPNAPDYSANAGISYETLPVIAGGSLTFRGDLSFKSRIFFREFGDVRDSQESNTVLNASIQWTSENGNYSVRAYGRNLTNEVYYSSLAQTSFLGNRFATWGAPRQYGVELRARF